MTWTLLAIAVMLGVIAGIVPMDTTIRKLTVAAAVICFVLWLLMILGVFGGVTVVHTHY